MGSLFPVVQKAIASVEPVKMEEIAKNYVPSSNIHVYSEKLICSC